MVWTVSVMLCLLAAQQAHGPPFLYFPTLAFHHRIIHGETQHVRHTARWRKSIFQEELGIQVFFIPITTKRLSRSRVKMFFLYPIIDDDVCVCGRDAMDRSCDKLQFTNTHTNTRRLLLPHLDSDVPVMMRSIPQPILP